MKVKDSIYFMLEYLLPSKHLHADSFFQNRYAKIAIPMWLLSLEQLWMHHICTDSLSVYPNWSNCYGLSLLCGRQKCTGTSCPLMNPFVKNTSVSKQVQMFNEHFSHWKDRFGMKAFPFKCTSSPSDTPKASMCFGMCCYPTQGLLTLYILDIFIWILLSFIPWKYTQQLIASIGVAEQEKDPIVPNFAFLLSFLSSELLYFIIRVLLQDPAESKLLWTWCCADIQWQFYHKLQWFCIFAFFAFLLGPEPKYPDADS